MSPTSPPASHCCRTDPSIRVEGRAEVTGLHRVARGRTILMQRNRLCRPWSRPHAGATGTLAYARCPVPPYRVAVASKGNLPCRKMQPGRAGVVRVLRPEESGRVKPRIPQIPAKTTGNSPLLPTRQPTSPSPASCEGPHGQPALRASRRPILLPLPHPRSRHPLPDPRPRPSGASRRRRLFQRQTPPARPRPHSFESPHASPPEWMLLPTNRHAPHHRSPAPLRQHHAAYPSRLPRRFVHRLPVRSLSSPERSSSRWL